MDATTIVESNQDGSALDGHLNALQFAETVSSKEMKLAMMEIPTLSTDVIALAKSLQDSIALLTPHLLAIQFAVRYLFLNLYSYPLGDGIKTNLEECDDGALVNGDGCSNTCKVEPTYECNGASPSVCVNKCGNGKVDDNEVCDDGARVNGDGCSSFCQQESGWACSNPVGGASVCEQICGNGITTKDEQCDDGNANSGDGCDDCEIETGYVCSGTPSVCTTSCGDGVRVSGKEACDDGNKVNGDGCSATCTIETGYTCPTTFGQASSCTPICGDRLIKGSETCDDGNTNAGDGCSKTCAVESGYTCTGAPSVCTTICGNGKVDLGETCDDGNTKANDGCSATCTIETGFECNTGADGKSVCDTMCGNGKVEGTEECDAGRSGSEGCTADCKINPSYVCSGSPSVCYQGDSSSDDKKIPLIVGLVVGLGGALIIAIIIIIIILVVKKKKQEKDSDAIAERGDNANRKESNGDKDTIKNPKKGDETVSPNDVAIVTPGVGATSKDSSSSDSSSSSESDSDSSKSSHSSSSRSSRSSVTAPPAVVVPPTGAVSSSDGKISKTMIIF